jgi:hypothetical protein
MKARESDKWFGPHCDNEADKTSVIPKIPRLRIHIICANP